MSEAQAVVDAILHGLRTVEARKAGDKPSKRGRKGETHQR